MVYRADTYNTNKQIHADRENAIKEATLQSKLDAGILTQARIAGQLDSIALVVGKLSMKNNDPNLRALAMAISKMADNVTKLPMQVPLPVASANRANRCDVNGDGKVDEADLTIVKNQILGITPVTAAGDVNRDGKHDVTD